MNIENLRDLDLNRLTRKSYGDDATLEKRVADILKRVREDGEEAVYQLTEEFDHINLRLSGLRVSDAEIQGAYQDVSEDYLAAMRTAKQNILKYHERQKRTSWMEPDQDGSILCLLYTSDAADEE